MALIRFAERGDPGAASDSNASAPSTSTPSPRPGRRAGGSRTGMGTHDQRRRTQSRRRTVPIDPPPAQTPSRPPPTSTSATPTSTTRPGSSNSTANASATSPSGEPGSCGTAPDGSSTETVSQSSELAKDVSSALYHQAAETNDPEAARKVAAWAGQTATRGRIESMVHLARGIEGVVISHDDLDTDPWLIGVTNGYINLRTGTFHPPDPDKLMTMQAPVAYDPDAEAPRWPGPHGMVPRPRSPQLRPTPLRPRTRRHPPATTLRHPLRRRPQRQRDLHAGPQTRPRPLLRHPRQVAPHPETTRANTPPSKPACSAPASPSRPKPNSGSASTKRKSRTSPAATQSTPAACEKTNGSSNPPTRCGSKRTTCPKSTAATPASGRASTSSRGPSHSTATPTPTSTQTRRRSCRILNWLIQGCLEWQRRRTQRTRRRCPSNLDYRATEDVLSRFAVDTGVRVRPKRHRHRLRTQTTNQTSGLNDEGVDKPDAKKINAWMKANGCRSKSGRYTRRDGTPGRGKTWRGGRFSLPDDDFPKPAETLTTYEESALPVTSVTTLPVKQLDESRIGVNRQHGDTGDKSGRNVDTPTDTSGNSTGTGPPTCPGCGTTPKAVYPSGLCREDRDTGLLAP